MSIVACGDETGDYYMILGNTRFTARWQDLKAFIRRGNPANGYGPYLSIDYVHIHAIGCGWACFHDRDEFLSAGDFLSSAEFEGKVLIPDTRNAYGPVSLGTVPDQAVVQRPALDTSTTIQPFEPGRQQFGTTYTHPVADTPGNTQPGQSVRLDSSGPPYTSQSGRQRSRVRNDNSDQDIVKSLRSTVQYPLRGPPKRDRRVAQESIVGPPARETSANKSRHVAVEHRGLHISNVSSETSEASIRSFIQAHAKLEPSIVQSVKRVNIGGGRNKKSYCIVILDSVTSSQAVQNTCQGQTLDGNIVKVKIDSWAVSYTPLREDNAIQGAQISHQHEDHPTVDPDTQASTGTNTIVTSESVCSPPVVDGSTATWGSSEALELLKRTTP